MFSGRPNGLGVAWTSLGIHHGVGVTHCSAADVIMKPLTSNVRIYQNKQKLKLIKAPMAQCEYPTFNITREAALTNPKG